MRILIIYLIVFFWPFLYSNAQKQTTIYLSVQNADSVNIEKREFFNMPEAAAIQERSLDWLYKQYIRGYRHVISEDFLIMKSDTYHYIIKHISDQPIMLYIGYRPVYVLPGDSLNVTYRVVLNVGGEFKDNITAQGKHAENYTFSNLDYSSLNKYHPELRGESMDNIAVFTQSLSEHVKRLNTFAQSKMEGCNGQLINYVKRENEIRYYISPLLTYAAKLKPKSVQQIWLVKHIDSVFANYPFVATDTLMSAVSEYLFRNYLNFLVHVKYKEMKDSEILNNINRDIAGLKNDFLKDYLSYFFIYNFKGKMDTVAKNVYIDNLKKTVKSPVIINQLKTNFLE